MSRYIDVVVISKPFAPYVIEEVNVDDASHPSPTRESTHDDMPIQFATQENITIYDYPLDVFPTTDFHTATYFRDPTSGKEYIFIVGGIGYPHTALRVIVQTSIVLTLVISVYRCWRQPA
jgi:hypothetical protein